MSRVNFRKTLGIIEQVDQKQQSPYQNILSFLQSPHSGQGKQNAQINILQQLDNFHQYYNQRHEQYKENYEKIKEQNWDYIMKYQQALENYQIISHESKQRVNYLQEKLSQVENLYQNKIAKIQQILHAKDQQIQELKAQLTKVNVKNQVPKKKIVKLKDKSIRVENDQNLNLESARSHRQMNNLKNQVLEYANQAEELRRQNESLRKRLKHLEADRKYEDDRLKNATLALQLDLKIKNEQIQRLNHQIQVYEKKFEEMIQTFRVSSNLQNCDKETVQITDFERQNTIDGRFYDQWKNIEVQQKTLGEQKDSQKTHRKLDFEVSEKGQRKTHKRYGSSNLQQNRKMDQELNLKIKVFKYNKNKKYI